LLDEFSEKKFGRNTELQKAGLTSLRLGRRTFALAINQACSLIGDDDAAVILKKLSLDHPKDAKSVYEACDLAHYVNKAHETYLRPGLYKLGNRLRFRILPNASVMVFYEDGQQLEDYRHFANLKGFLAKYGERESSIETMY